MVRRTKKICGEMEIETKNEYENQRQENDEVLSIAE